MQLKIDAGLFTSNLKKLEITEGADVDLDILLKRESCQEDGYLRFQRGRCYEEGGDWKKAEASYENAIKYNPTQRIIEAYKRLATLLRDHYQPPEREEADKTIEAMVQSDPENSKVYLARGQYLLSDPEKSKRTSLLRAARDDFQKAKQLAPAQPEIYFLLAKTFEEEGNAGRDKMRQIVEDGLKKAPTSMVLYEFLARSSYAPARSTRRSRLWKTAWLKVSEPAYLRFLLAELLAERGANAKLDSQLVELRKLEVSEELRWIILLHYTI